MVQSYDPSEHEDNERNVQSLVDKLFPDHGPDLKDYEFVFKDGNHYVSSWKGIQVDNNLYIEIPDGVLPAGSRECFVSLLEFCEESLDTGAMFLCVPKQRNDTAEVLRTFMFIGFEVVHHSTCSMVPLADEYIFMAYEFE